LKFYLSAKKLDLSSGDQLICIINELDADQYGIGLNAGDRVEVSWNGLEEPLIVTIDTTEGIVARYGSSSDNHNNYSESQSKSKV